MTHISLIEHFDGSILLFIQNNLHAGFLDRLMPGVTALGNAGAIWIAAAIALLLTKRFRRQGLLLLAVLALCYVSGNLLLKPIAARIRPCNADAAAVLLIPRPTDFSFPSGHTMTSFACAAVIAYVSPVAGIGAYLLAFLIAFSRLYLYVHYPSDVLAGMLIGTALALLCVMADKRLKMHIRT